MTSEILLALDDALAELGRARAAEAQLVDLRYFAGLTIEQAADVLGISRGHGSSRLGLCPSVAAPPDHRRATTRREAVLGFSFRRMDARRPVDVALDGKMGIARRQESTR